MGTCFECVVQICAHHFGVAQTHGDWRLARACLTRVSDGLEVRSIESPRIELVPREGRRD
jgi:hypothetical protein